MSEPNDLLVALRDRIDIGPAPVGDIVHQGRRRLLRRRSAAAVVAAVLLVAGTVTGALVVRDRHHQVSPAKSAFEHAWWADGALHVGGRTVAVPGVQRLVQIPGSVVVADADGDVIKVRPDGTRATVGHHKWATWPDHPGNSLLLDHSTGMLAWVDGGDRVQEIVVYDPANDVEVARHRIQTDWTEYPVWLRAFDGGVVYFDQRDGGTRSWRVSDDHVEKLYRGSYIMDAENGLWLTDPNHGNGHYTVLDRGEVRWTIAAAGGIWEFSPNAAWLLTRSSGESFSLGLWNVATGEQVPTGLPAESFAFASYPGDDGKITYAVGRSRQGPFDLIQCDAGAGDCTTVVENAADQLPVVLPEDQP
jgi:hypothetical protein